MQGSNETTRNRRRKLASALMATLLAVAMSFMAFDANTLSTAFANDEITEQEASVQQEMSDADDEAVPTSGEMLDTETTEQPVSPNPAPADPESDDTAESARDGPQVASVGSSGAAVQGAGVSENGGSEVIQDGEFAEPASTSLDDGEAATCVVTFFSDAPENNPSILARKSVSAEAGQVATISVSDVLAEPPTSVQEFDGWTYQGSVYRDVIELDPRDGDVSLYPSFLDGHWLRFVSGDINSDATYVPSQFVSANSAGLESLPVPSRTGYAFEGWHVGNMQNDSIEYGRQVTDSNGTVLDKLELREDLARDDVELYAKWQGVQTQYRIITWHEKPDAEGYSFHDFETIGDDEGEVAIAGTMTNVVDVPHFDGFTLVDFEQRQIKGDGSTVVNLYYDRNEYSVVFHQDRAANSPIFDELTITAKYGADIHDRWPTAENSNGGYTAAWYTLPDESSKVFVTGIGTMPLGGADYYLMDETGLNCNLVFRVQNVDGSNTFTDYVSQPFTSPESVHTTADDYKPIKGFMVNAASDDDATAISAIPAGDKGAIHKTGFTASDPIGTYFDDAPETTITGDVPRHTLYIYYLRCQYNLVFEGNGGPEPADLENIYYEASLASLEPSDFVAGETSYVANDGEKYTFQGWYDNEALQGEPFDFETGTMPAGNLVLYASWTPTDYLVQVNPAGGVFSSSAQSTYFYVDHGDTVGAIPVERNYIEDPYGGFVYYYETASTDPGSDQFGSVLYLPASDEDDAERYRYEQGAYALYGWYQVGLPTLTAEPFDFNDPITEDTSIVARWRSAGTFDIAYDPTSYVGDDLVTGEIETLVDDGYADLSPTLIVNTPREIRSVSGDEYEFVGWQVVEGFEFGSDVLVYDLFEEGDPFVVDSEFARWNTIHLRAVYEAPGEDPADPVDPVDPADPVVPDDPATPDDPTTPDDPDSPVTPVEPSSPEDNASGDVTGDGTDDDGNDIAVESQAAPSSVSNTYYDAASALPKTGDLAMYLALAIGGLSLLALCAALCGRALHRGVRSIHIDQRDQDGS